LRQHVVRDDPVRARRDAPPRGPGPGRLGRDDRPRSRLRRRGRAAPMVMRRAEGALEVLDGDVGAADLAATLADVDRLNTWFGGYALSLREIRRLAAGVARDHTLRVVDVGGGAAAFAVRLVQWARRSGRAIRVVVIERDAVVLGFARPAVGAALVLERRAAGAGRAGGRASVDDPRIPGAGTHAGGPVVTADVIVVGAGPAGAATAILLAEHGLSVRVVDRARFPRPK